MRMLTWAFFGSTTPDLSSHSAARLSSIGWTGIRASADALLSASTAGLGTLAPSRKQRPSTINCWKASKQNLKVES